MTHILSFVAVWIGMMALIGLALFVVARASKKKSGQAEEKLNETQDIADE